MHARLSPLGFRVGLFASLLTLTACSVDIMQIPASRVNSAKLAEKPLLRGDGAPGAFKHTWLFKEPKSFLFDPSTLTFEAGAARIKANAKQAVLMTQFGPSYTALDSFKELGALVENGKLSYQLSNDGTHWFYNDGKAWAAAAPIITKTNTEAEINAHINRFHLEAGPGTLQMKVFFSPSTEPKTKGAPLLQGIEVKGVSARTDGWD